MVQEKKLTPHPALDSALARHGALGADPAAAAEAPGRLLDDVDDVLAADEKVNAAVLDGAVHAKLALAGLDELVVGTLWLKIWKTTYRIIEVLWAGCVRQPLRPTCTTPHTTS